MNDIQKIADIVFDHLGREPKVRKLAKLGVKDEEDIKAIEELYADAWSKAGVTIVNTPTNFGNVGVNLAQDYKRDEAKSYFIDMLSDP